MVVREATERDAPELAGLVSEFDGAPISAELALRRFRAIQHLETVLLAQVEAEQAVGFCSLHLRPWLTADHPYAELTELFVRPGWRRRGVGTALVRRAEAMARDRGARDLVLLTGFRNAAAQAFYRAMGYEDYCLAMRRKPL